MSRKATAIWPHRFNLKQNKAEHERLHQWLVELSYRGEASDWMIDVLLKAVPDEHRVGTEKVQASNAASTVGTSTVPSMALLTKDGKLVVPEVPKVVESEKRNVGPLHTPATEEVQAENIPQTKKAPTVLLHIDKVARQGEKEMVGVATEAPLEFGLPMVPAGWLDPDEVGLTPAERVQRRKANAQLKQRKPGPKRKDT